MATQAMTVNSGRVGAFAMVGAVDLISKTTGKVTGQRISFNGAYPAGDIKKALRESNPSLKGKALTAEVDKVLRGDATIDWAIFEATVSAARSGAFKPQVGKLNKAGDKLTLTLQKASTVITQDEAKQALKQSMTPDELIKFCEATLAAQKEEAAKKEALENKEATKTE